MARSRDQEQVLNEFFGGDPEAFDAWYTGLKGKKPRGWGEALRRLQAERPQEAPAGYSPDFPSSGRSWSEENILEAARGGPESQAVLEKAMNRVEIPTRQFRALADRNPEVRDWERQWVTGEIQGAKDRMLARIDEEQKMKDLRSQMAPPSIGARLTTPSHRPPVGPREGMAAPMVPERIRTTAAMGPESEQQMRDVSDLKTLLDSAIGQERTRATPRDRGFQRYSDDEEWKKLIDLGLAPPTMEI